MQVFYCVFSNTIEKIDFEYESERQADHSHGPGHLFCVGRALTEQQAKRNAHHHRRDIRQRRSCQLQL